MKKFLAVLLLLAPTLALSATVTLTWTRPTAYNNGQTMPVTDLAGYEVECTQFTPLSGPAVACSLGIKTVPGGATLTYTYDVGVVPASGGAYSFVVRAKTTATAAVPNKLSDSTSPVQSQVFASAAPNPPGNVTVTAQTAYNVIKQRDRFVMLPVGTVPVGVACDPTQSVNGYNVVPRSEVRWTGNARPEVVVALCASS